MIESLALLVVQCTGDTNRFILSELDKRMKEHYKLKVEKLMSEEIELHKCLIDYGHLGPHLDEHLCGGYFMFKDVSEAMKILAEFLVVNNFKCGQ